MSSTTLIRFGGFAAIVAGLLRGISSFFPGGASGIGIELLYLVTDICILFGIMGVYSFQHQESGLFGFIGFVLGVIGTGMIIGPDGAIADVPIYPLGASLLAVGFILLAIGSWVANKLPRWIPLLWILAMLLGFIGYFGPGLSLMFVLSGILFGISFASAGLKIGLTVISHKI